MKRLLHLMKWALAMFVVAGVLIIGGGYLLNSLSASAANSVVKAKGYLDSSALFVNVIPALIVIFWDHVIEFLYPSREDVSKRLALRALKWPARTTFLALILFKDLVPNLLS